MSCHGTWKTDSIIRMGERRFKNNPNVSEEGRKETFLVYVKTQKVVIIGWSDVKVSVDK